MRTPANLNLIWRHTHPDYKGKIDGVRYVLVNEKGKGTVSVPLQSLHEDELRRMLEYAQSREARGLRPYRS